jgi:hypothetical protein
MLDFKYIPVTVESLSNITDLDALIGRLENQLADLKEFRNQKISPLCRIPDELLTHILSFLWDAMMEVRSPRYISYDDCEELVHMDPDRYPEEEWWAPTGSAVCRRVWAIALRTPDLWSTIRHNYMPESECCIRSADSTVRRQVRHYLQRGANRPPKLQIGFVETTEPRYEDMDLHPALLKLVPRMHSVTIILDCDDRHLPVELPVCQRLLSRRWKSLEHLEVSATGTFGRDPKVKRYLDKSFLGGNPGTLKVLDLSWTNGGFWTIVHAPRFPQLQHLRISGLDLSGDTAQLRSLLSQTPFLVSLSLDLCVDELTVPLQSMAMAPVKQKLNMHHLETIHIKAESPALQLAHDLLDLLPDPCIHLSVHHERREQALEIDIDALTHATVTRLMDCARPNVANINYHIVLTAKFRGNLRWLRLTAASPIGHKPLNAGRTIEYVGEYSTELLSRMLKMAHTIEFEPDVHESHFDMIMAAIRTAPNLHHIRFHHWFPFWARERSILRAQFIDALEENLRERKNRGTPVKTLILDRRSYASRERNIDEKWLKDGLVMEVIQRPMYREFGPEWIYSDESESESSEAAE